VAYGGRIVLEERQPNDAADPPRFGPKPTPARAAELRIAPACCFVAEDAPAGIEAAKAGGMTGLGVARLGDEVGLRAARADLVVTSLDDVAIDELVNGRLCRRST
jgi:beta-phosphoglucomutase